MWIVINYKKKELNILKEEIKKKIDICAKFYNPKIHYFKKMNNKLQKYQKYILDNYVFCFSSNFKENRFKNKINFCRGLNYILSGFQTDQNEIMRFIDLCKSYENQEGSIDKKFFLDLDIKKGKFINGPFNNLIFNFLNKEKNKSKIQLGNKVIILQKNSNILFSPV